MYIVFRSSQILQLDVMKAFMFRSKPDGCLSIFRQSRFLGSLYSSEGFSICYFRGAQRTENPWLQRRWYIRCSLHLSTVGILSCHTCCCILSMIYVQFFLMSCSFISHLFAFYNFQGLLHMVKIPNYSELCFILTKKLTIFRHSNQILLPFSHFAFDHQPS